MLPLRVTLSPTSSKCLQSVFQIFNVLHHKSFSRDKRIFFRPDKRRKILVNSLIYDLLSPAEAEGLLTVLRLPPGLLAVRLEGGDHVLDAVVDGVVHRVVRPARVAVETLLLVLRERRRRLQPQSGREITVMRADAKHSLTCR